jgi:transcription antitermination factor NusG
MKRHSGNSFGEITIGAVTVRARWRYSYRQASEVVDQELSGATAWEGFMFIALLTIAERKKVGDLKQGDWTRLTAGPFIGLPVWLKDIEYKETKATVAVSFFDKQRR